MASLKKIALCGIRSFGPSEGDEQQLVFDKPLTVIVGRNGCGKSTIIEALRFVTAQKEPPGRGAFVHDPNLTDHSSVKGFVKLLLKDATNEHVTISKALQATRTKVGVNMRTLDCTINRKDRKTGKPISISSRCVDISSEIMKIFGVSRAILESVIFCTQEDSNWPLDTDQKIKEKFDQIFDSEKYNKCLKKVRDKRKKMMESKGLSETELKHLKDKKAAAVNKRNQKSKIEREIEKFNDEVKMYDDSLIPIANKLRDIRKNEEELNKVYTKCETLKTELKVICNNETELKKKIVSMHYEFIGNDEELSNALQACEIKGRSEISLKSELVQTEREESQLSEKNKQLFSELSQLKKLIELNEDKISSKKAKMQKIASLFQLDSSNISEENLERRVKNKEGDLNDLLKHHERCEEICQSEIDKAREKLFSQESLVKQKEMGLNENRCECKKLKIELEDVEASEARLERVATSLRKATQDLNDHTRINNIDELKADVRRWQIELNQNDEQLTAVDEEVRTLQEQSSVVKELEMQRDNLNEKSAGIKRLRNIHADSLEELLGSIPNSGFKRVVEGRVEALQKKLKELQISHTSKEKEVTSLEGQRKFLSDSLKEKQSMLANYKEQIYDATNGDNWSEKVQNMQRIVDELLDERGNLTSSSAMYERYIRALQRPKPCCPLCSRDFKADQDAIQLAEDLARKMRDVPKRIESNARELEENQNKLNKLLALESVQERMQILESQEIPLVNTKLAEVEENLLKTRKELEEIIAQKQKPEKDVAICSNLQGDMTLLDQLLSDHLLIKQEVERLELRLPAGGPKKSLREVLASQDSLRHKRKLANHNLSESQARLNKYNETLQTLQTSKHALAEELRSLEGGGSSRKVLEDRYCELQGLEAVFSEELNSAKEAVYPLQDNVKQRLQELKDLKANNRSIIDGKRRELENLQKQLDEIKRLGQEICDFQRKGVEKKLATVEDNIEKTERELKVVKTKKESINAQIGDTAKIEVRRRELEDNKTLRQFGVDRNKFETRIKEMEEKFGNLDYESLMREKRKAIQEEENIGKSKARLNGQIEALITQCKQLEQELHSPMFKNIDDEYKKELIKSHVSEAAASDLLRYAACMEYAMSVYHTQQMQKVNSFIREYWRKIYQGNDVEYIEIQTEECQVSEKRRNYNYRLVQVKNGVRLDMRNRCSAGQKMLACLIIRMALSEVFSGSCGILTLDEPTTNLDTKNVKTLARALNEITTCKESSLYTNFQLIVITHDESFLEELVQVNAVQSYVEVYRDSFGKSKIKRVDVQS